MNRIALAKELVGLAREMTAGKQKYKGYTIEPSGMNFYVTDPSGHRAFGEVPASVETAKKWIDMDIREKGKKSASEMTALDPAVPGAVDPRLARLTTMNLSDIASLIYDDHRAQRKQVNYAAKPYLEAMSTLQHIGDMYMQDSGSSIVAYLLGNLTSWKGDVARAVKKELNRRLR